MNHKRVDLHVPIINKLLLVTTICENYKLTTNGACFMRRFRGGNSFQIAFLRESKIDKHQNWYMVNKNQFIVSVADQEFSCV
jgi:hypothetical protein